MNVQPGQMKSKTDWGEERIGCREKSNHLISYGIFLFFGGRRISGRCNFVAEKGVGDDGHLNHIFFAAAGTARLKSSNLSVRQKAVGRYSRGQTPEIACQRRGRHT